MHELIKVNYDTADRPSVSGRELWEALEVKTAYKDWFPRMCEYGFTEGEDFCSFLSESTGGRPATDHALTIPMAKELCMLQRTDKGREIRRYFISVEEAWNSPEAIMSRALRIADQNLERAKFQIKSLETEVAVQSQQIAELQPKGSFYDVVLNCKDLLSVNEIAKDYGKSAKWLNKFLHEKGIQYKQGKIWLLYQKYAEKGYTSTKTQVYNGKDGEIHSKVHTYWTQAGRLFLYDLLKENGYHPLAEKEDETWKH